MKICKCGKIFLRVLLLQMIKKKEDYHLWKSFFNTSHHSAKTKVYQKFHLLFI